jgi:hypothetical protein
MMKCVLIFAALLPLTSMADPAADVRDAVTTLASARFSWETTVRQRFKAETTEPRLDPSAAIEIRGKFDPSSYTEVTLLPARDGLPVAVTAVSRMGDVVGYTPLGWLRRPEMRSAPGSDRTVDFEGHPVRLSRALSVALRATTLRPPTEDLFDLIADVKSYRSTNGVIVGELRDATIEKLWGDPQAKRAPEIQGAVIFKLGDGLVTEFHVALAIGFPNSRTKKTTWSVAEWTTRISEVGSTTVDPPAAAVKRLED